MKKLLLASSVTFAAVPAVSAQAEVPPVAGAVCNYQAHYDFAAETTAVVYAGPLIAAMLPGDVALVSLTLTCTIRASGARHDDPVLASASATGTGVVALAPTVLTYHIPDDALIDAVCTKVEVTDTANATWTYYWIARESEFTTDSSAPWGIVLCPASPDPCGVGVDAKEEVRRLSVEVVAAAQAARREHVDPVTCPYLAMLFPPDGDVLFVDCAPYWS